MMGALVFRWLAPPLTFLVVILAWQASVVFLHIQPLVLPAPTAVLHALLEAPGWFMVEGAYTLATTMSGFAIALVVGVALAVLIVEVRFFESTVYALITGLNSVPKVAVAPLFIIWLGVGSAPKVAIAFLIAFFPIVIDTVLGLRSVQPEMLDLARTMQASRFGIFWRIRLPCALPSLFAGMKVGISLALVGAIVGEFVATDHGLGYIILTAQGTFDTPQIFAATALLAVAGMVLFAAMSLLERWVLPWRAPVRH
jgi:NitT/TauT family transport system permease protein